MYHESASINAEDSDEVSEGRCCAYQSYSIKVVVTPKKGKAVSSMENVDWPDKSALYCDRHWVQASEEVA